MPRPARHLAEAVRRGRLDPVDLVEGALARVERRADLGAVVESHAPQARAEARRLRRRTGRMGPLAGVPVLVKDNVCTRAGHTTCCSRMLAGYRAPDDATAVARLRDAGAIVVGKTTCDEFGLGSSTETAWQGPARNPHDPSRVPGGSSGGSAAAVAAGIVPLALGSDTGGSVRQPAALCGVVGLKPTWGGISRRGLVAFASSFDQIGPLGATVDDVALAFRVMAGPDPADATSGDRPFRADHATWSGGRIGIVDVEPGSPLAPAVEQAARTLGAAGMSVGRARLPDPHRSLFVYLALSAAELSSNLARFDGVRYGLRAAGAKDLDALYRRTRARGFGAEVRRRILLGTAVLAGPPDASRHARARAARRAIVREMGRLFETFELLLGPTTDGPAFLLGERLADPLAMYASDAHTVLASLAGLPAISLPAPARAGALPLGIQLMAPWNREDRLLAAARLLEEAGFRVEGPR